MKKQTINAYILDEITQEQIKLLVNFLDNSKPFDKLNESEVIELAVATLYSGWQKEFPAYLPEKCNLKYWV